MGKYKLDGVREPQPQEEVEPQRTTAERLAPPLKPAHVREPGKRSTPGFTRTTVYMRDDTKFKAVRLLQDLKDKRDLSDLIESLLSNWVSKHSSA